jgi:surface polysaccharide O-acyltransferase-like enzyme
LIHKGKKNLNDTLDQRAFRDGQIETLRGIACLLLVAFHVIGSPQTGMHVADNSGWRMLTTLFTPVRMPLFAFISGYVFTVCTLPRRELWAALTKKFRRLGIPLISASLIYDAAYIVVGDGKAKYSIFELLFYPFIHLWFLQAALLIATLTTILMMVFRVSRLAFALGLFGASLAASQLVPFVTNDVFSIAGMLYLLPFFSCGVVMRTWSREPLFEKHKSWLIRALLIGIVMTLLTLGWWRSASLPWAGRYDIGNVALSCVICVALYLMRFRLSWLELIGPFSYTIYLFHPLFSSMSRKILQHSGHDFSNAVVFVAGMTAGIVLPITLHKLLSHNRAGAFVLLGVDYSKFRGRAAGAINRGAAAALR